ncbi:hypothetical protein L5F07_04270 [Aliarcobacter butzleri]|uniref:hypothetical protein n=1 Tax=Aliarcobacter butzleri TaxID=28197 RepID=UPI001EDB7804|nr:hypothetical protein [Aliarcobacter butzleri]MCG3678468.1 hypothetical protein [Aliarcobacter butzleri]
MDSNKNILKTVIKLKNEFKENLDSDISIYSNFQKMYYYDNSKLREIIKKTNAGRINLILEDIDFIIKRIDKIIFKINQISNDFLESHNEELMHDLTELSYFYSSYSLSIVDKYRTIKKEFNIYNYDEKRKEIFGKDCLHDLITLVRNTSTHGKLYRVFRIISYNFDKDSKTIKLTLEKKFLLEDENLKSNVKEYLLNQKEEVDISEIYITYLEKIKIMFNWFKNEVDIQYEKEMIEFNKYNSWLKELDTQTIDGLNKQLKNK